jgi:hypothetical protein
VCCFVCDTRRMERVLVDENFPFLISRLYCDLISWSLLTGQEV